MIKAVASVFAFVSLVTTGIAQDRSNGNDRLLRLLTEIDTSLGRLEQSDREVNDRLSRLESRFGEKENWDRQNHEPTNTRATMPFTFHAALFVEQDVQFVIVPVQPWVLESTTKANGMVEFMDPIFPDRQVVLMTVGRNGRFFGREDIVRFLAQNADVSAIRFPMYTVDYPLSQIDYK